MILDLQSTKTSQVNKKLVELRETGGAVALGRVLTLVIVTDDGTRTEEAVDAANDASREHPCRVIVVARGARQAAPRLDAQIRVGGDAGASEVIVLRLYGPLADEGAGCVVPLLLPDAPVVAWWPVEGPVAPATDPIGRLATRRITDAAAEKNPIKALDVRRKSYVEGDTDLAWSRLTTWRAVLAAALDLPPHEPVTSAVVTGESDSPSTDLLAAWLANALRVPVRRVKATSGEGIVSVALERPSGMVELVRPNGHVGTLTQPGQPDRRVALQRRQVRDCLAEELRRLEPDVVYEATLKGLAEVLKPRVAPARTDSPAGEQAESQSATAAKSKTGTKTRAKATGKPAASRSAKKADSTSADAATGDRPAPKPTRRSAKKTDDAAAGTTGAATTESATTESATTEGGS